MLKISSSAVISVSYVVGREKREERGLDCERSTCGKTVCGVEKGLAVALISTRRVLYTIVCYEALREYINSFIHATI